jgi:mono/diheme cytochrome c family protein
MKKPILFFLPAATLLAAAFVQMPAPVRASADQKRLGATLFHEKGCEHCHGIDGRGGELGPDLSTIGKRWDKRRIERQIHDGAGGMPAFADTLQTDEIAALVEFLHSKRKAPKGPGQTPPPPAQTVPN